MIEVEGLEQKAAEREECGDMWSASKRKQEGGRQAGRQAGGRRSPCYRHFDQNCQSGQIQKQQQDGADDSLTASDCPVCHE